MTRPNRLGTTFQALEARVVPAFVTRMNAGHLKIVFNNDSTTDQSVVVSAVNGKVTLNEHPTRFKASAVRSITVVGSDLGNFIDLKFVSTQTGFRRLDGKVKLYGNGGDDVLFGSQFGDKLSGGDGFDQIFAGNGNDTLDGGAGTDWLYPGYGDDTILVSPGNDWMDRLEPGDRVV